MLSTYINEALSKIPGGMVPVNLLLPRLLQRNKYGNGNTFLFRTYISRSGGINVIELGMVPSNWFDCNWSEVNDVKEFKSLGIDPCRELNCTSLLPWLASQITRWLTYNVCSREQLVKLNIWPSKLLKDAELCISKVSATQNFSRNSYNVNSSVMSAKPAGSVPLNWLLSNCLKIVVRFAVTTLIILLTYKVINVVHWEKLSGIVPVNWLFWIMLVKELSEKEL